jgi:light-regulated signal transduction histidine kinase (bacteriophytochrome)
MITSYSQLLVRRYGSQFDENASQYARYITESAQRMTELLNDLLSYARAGADTDGMVEVVDFNAIAAEAVENLQASIAEGGATVICDPLPQVHGRQAHFVQLVQNLISNALKYRSEQPPDIHISAEQVRGRWRFAVTDNGIGIDPKYHQNIFGVFKRLHNRSIPGTGIGLAICQRVVERYGGRIWVESHAGHGATFYFTLPVMKDSQPAAQASAESA